MTKPFALLSVTDKRGIAEFGKALSDRGFDLLSTGGTAKALREAGLTVTEVSDATGYPEMLDGRVKTLHPVVHAGILADRRLPAHRSTIDEEGIRPIDVVAVNLYAFEATVSEPHELDDAIESIDIGGPAMVRSAAKNHASVAVLVDPDDYAKFIEALDSGVLPAMRQAFAAKAFRHTAFYDSCVARYLTEAVGEDPLDKETLTLGYRRVMAFRYGENPHQRGALFSDPLAKMARQAGLPQARSLWGKEISYNNVNDSEGAWELVGDLPPGACAIIKHGNPCGAAVGETLADSYLLARASDPISAFGGIAAFNQKLDLAAAEAMTEKGNFLEVVIAPDWTEEALEIFKNRSGWGQDVRLIQAALPTSKKMLTIKTVRGGAIAQESDEEQEIEWSLATKVRPSASQYSALQFAWTVVKHVRSNAIVVCGANRLLGVGAGQMNRVQSVRLALEQAGEGAKGAVLASDAFFPFPDSIETAAAAGIAAIVQPGGSKKDQEVIAAADRLGIAMVLTGVRHFKH